MRKRQLQQRLNGGCNYSKEDMKRRRQKGKLIGSLWTRTTSECDNLTRLQGTSLVTLRGRGTLARRQSKRTRRVSRRASEIRL